MFVRQERGDTLEDDRERTRRLVERVRETGESGLRVWTPPPHVNFGRRDANEPTFDRARKLAEERGYPTAVRSSGGRAVAHTDGTLAFVLAVPTDAERSRIESRYERAVGTLEEALSDLGVEADRGEPADAFCPGSHSLQIDDRKIAGLAQRVRDEVAVLTGIVVVRDEATVAGVLQPVYEVLDLTLDPSSVGSLASAGGPDDATVVGDTVGQAFRDRRLD